MFKSETKLTKAPQSPIIMPIAPRAAPDAMTAGQKPVYAPDHTMTLQLTRPVAPVSSPPILGFQVQDPARQVRALASSAQNTLTLIDPSKVQASRVKPIQAEKAPARAPEEETALAANIYKSQRAAADNIHVGPPLRVVADKPDGGSAEPMKRHD